MIEHYRKRGYSLKMKKAQMLRAFKVKTETSGKKCDKYYVGETGKAFRSRIYRQKLSVKKTKENRGTPVSKHFTDMGYCVKDLNFSFLEWYSLNYHIPKPEHEKE